MSLLSRLWGLPSLLLVLATLFWSGNFVLGRALHLEMPPVAWAFWRWVLAGSIVMCFAWPRLRQDAAAIRRHLGLLSLLAFLGVTSFNTLVYHGLHTTTAINAVLLQSIMPILIFAGSFVLFAIPVSPKQALALAISLLGVAVIVSAGSLDTFLQLDVAPGDGWIFLAVVLYALYSVLLRRRPEIHPLSFLAVTFGIGAALLLPLYLWEWTQVGPMQLNRTSLIAIGYVGVFPSILSYLCFNRAVALAGANRAGQFIHLMPVFGTALAALFLGESLRPYHAVGAGLIAVGILLNKPNQRAGQDAS